MSASPPLDYILSPHAQQALIAGLFIASGWWVAGWQGRRRDSKARDERVIDMQRAILAEIRAHVVELERQIASGEMEAITTRVQMGDASVVLPHGGNDRIFHAMISDIHVLPGAVIDPVVIYYRLLTIMDKMAEAIRHAARKSLNCSTEMLIDYLALNEAALEAGLDALEVLTASLHGGEAAVNALMLRQMEESSANISANLSDELSDLRERLSKRSSDRSGQ